MSMSPLVRDGDVLLVRPVESRAIRLGDVVLYVSGQENVVVHRVIGRAAGPAGPCFVVQGDRGGRPDGLIPGVNVYGRVAAIERAGARIDMDGPAMKVLGWLALLRSRRPVGRGWPSRLVRQVLRRLPGFSRYLV